MIWEYLLLNLVIISGPVALSFDKKVRYFRYWKKSIYSIIIIMIPFIIWDALVTGRHWWFNENYITGFRIANLPIEEWMFFITVPFAVLFIWQIFSYHTGNPRSSGLRNIKYLMVILLLPGIIFFLNGREYTGLVLLALAVTGLTDILLKTELFSRKNTYFYLALITILNLVFNGYLTGRPVVIYDESYQLGIRLISIPIEDFFYGYSLILLNTLFFEKFKGLDRSE